MKKSNLQVAPYRQKGFTLVETLLVLVIVTFISTIAVSRLYNSKSDVGGIERFVDAAGEKINERRQDARRLNGELSHRTLEKINAPPLVINFSDLSTTASLWTEGKDENGDCLDDVSEKPLTCLSQGKRGRVSYWNYAYTGEALKLPVNWAIAQSPEILVKRRVPLIGAGQNGRGVMVTQIAFDGRGRVFGYENGVWSANPGGQTANYEDEPNLDNDVFWAIYLLDESASESGVAITVSPSAQIQILRFDGKNWIGVNGRIIK